MSSLVPSDPFPNGAAALHQLIAGATSVSAAVAFVSDAGVQRLGAILKPHGDVALEVVARAAGVTSPTALIALREELGAEVSVVIGEHASSFHPKLWLVRSSERLSILSGSGNLTEAGLVENDEQFEVIHVPLTSDEASAHERRFDRLTAHAFRLNDVEGSPIWTEWLTVIKKQRLLRKQLEDLEAALASRTVRMSREKDKLHLLQDLDDLYERTVEARLVQRDGKRYMPNRFKQGIERARAGADPVLLVTRMCRRQTEGFDVILEADRPDLTVEVLLLDESKPYHDLLSEQTLRVSKERLHRFPSWPA